MNFESRHQKGQSLIELLAAMSIFVLVISGIMYLALGAHMSNLQGAERSKATLLAQAGAEAAASIQNQGWKFLTIGQYGINYSQKGYWELVGDYDTVDKFTRQVTIAPATRDSNGGLVSNGGTVDFDTKRVTSKVSWDSQPSRPSEVILESYVTNWKSLKWKQTAQDGFNRGDRTNVAVQDGQLQLARQPGTKTFDWTFDMPGDYQYDQSKIEVAGSQAQLVGTGTIIASGQTTNPGFNNNINPWNFATWDRNSGEPAFSGVRVSSGGNPGGWARVRYVGTASQAYQTGGFFQQQFTVSTSAITDGRLHFDWQVQQIYGAAMQPRAKLYAFISQNASEPVVDSPEQVWSSDWLTGVVGWTPVDVNITDHMPQQGNYYIKLAVWVEGGAGVNAINIGFDNAQVTWQKSELRYPTDNPTIQPAGSLQAVDILEWQTFVERADKNGGEIYYQLSGDNGATWQYWTGNRWRQIQNPRNYNTASEVNSQIKSFPANSQQLMFRAFLSSDGTQRVALDNVAIGYLAANSGNYYSSGSFISEAFNTNAVAPIHNYLAWASTVPEGASLRFQVRTAGSQLDLATTPWAGPDGTTTTYFTQAGTTIFGEIGLPWVQYQVYFTSNGADTPLLSNVIWDYEQ
jgi:hypothetical protein